MASSPRRVASQDYHDGEWGHLEEAIDEALERRGSPRSMLKDLNEPRASGSDYVKGDAFLLLDDEPELDDEPNRDEQRASRHEHRPEDVALLAAAEPEPVSDEEVAAARAARQGSVRPIGEVLLDVAADWRAKAREARATGCDLKPYTASHKLHGQADLLEECAATLEATLTGKEGR